MPATEVRPKIGLVFKHVSQEGTFRVTQVESEFTTYGKLNEYGRVDKLGYGGRRRRVRTARFSEIVAEVVGQGSIKPKQNAGPKLSDAEFAALFERAHEAGMAAGEGARPTPMIVERHANPLDDNSPVVQRYAPVMDGVCGFAWIQVKPGNGAFARWLKKTGKGRTDSYYGGVSIWVRYFGQSMERKDAYAQAFAEVLREAGIRAFSDSRMD